MLEQPYYNLIRIQMNQKQKILLKKSSLQLQQGAQMQTKQQSPIIKPANDISFLTDKSIQNLLDLDESFVQKRKQYQKFLQNRIIVIEGPELVTQNVIKSYKLYKIKSRKSNDYDYDTCVSRRFSDFQYLQKQLVQNYGGCIIPLLPEKNIWATVNMQGEQQISSRVTGLQKYLKSLLNHSKLKMSDELRNFLFENQIKFSQKKGEYFSKIKTQQKIKQIASNAYNIGKGLFQKYITGNQSKYQNNNHVLKPNVDDVRLMEHQRQVTDLIKVINVLRKVVQNSVIQMKTVGLILPQSKQSTFESVSILNQFQDLCKYIFSCNQALSRRHVLRLQIDQLNTEYESLQKKIKSNPRSSQIDMLRNKLSKSTQKCEKWTSYLLQELQQSISVGKSMIQKFINEYSSKKQKFYDL